MKFSKRGFLGLLAAFSGAVVSSKLPAAPIPPAEPELLWLRPETLVSPTPEPIFGEWRVFAGDLTENDRRERLLKLSWRVFDGAEWRDLGTPEAEAVHNRLLALNAVRFKKDHAEWINKSIVAYEHGESTL